MPWCLPHINLLALMDPSYFANVTWFLATPEVHYSLQNRVGKRCTALPLWACRCPAAQQQYGVEW